MNYQERFPVEAGDFASAGEVSATIKQKLNKIGVAQALVRRMMGFGAGMGLPNISKNVDDLKIKSDPSGTRMEMVFFIA